MTNPNHTNCNNLLVAIEQTSIFIMYRTKLIAVHIIDRLSQGRQTHFHPVSKGRL